MHDSSYQIYLEQIKERPACSDEEVRALLEQIKEGKTEAREQLLEGMLQFTAKLAGRHAGQGVPMGDLVQESNMALIMALEEYKSGDFRAQVREKADGRMMLLIESHKNQRIVHEEMIARIHVLQKVSQVLAEEFGREPTLAELAAKMRMTEDEVRIIMKETLNAMSVSPDVEG